MKASFEVDLMDALQVNALINFLQHAVGAPAATVPATPATGTKKQPAAAPGKATAAKTAITLDELREATSKAVQAGHRDDIKKKLDELGAPKVSELKPEHFEAYKNFLDKL